MTLVVVLANLFVLLLDILLGFRIAHLTGHWEWGVLTAFVLGYLSSISSSLLRLLRYR